MRANLEQQFQFTNQGIFQIGVGRILGTFEKFFPIDDLDHAVLGGSIGGINAVPFGPGGHYAVQVRRNGTRGTGLLPRQTEIADEHGLRRIAQIIDLSHARGAPADLPEIK